MTKSKTDRVTFGKSERAAMYGDGATIAVLLDGQHVGEITAQMASAYLTVNVYRVASYDADLDLEGDAGRIWVKVSEAGARAALAEVKARVRAALLAAPPASTI